MNEKVKTSGGNVIAIVVLLFIGYTTFIQLTYQQGNTLGISFLLALLIVGLIASIFIGLQVLKGTDKKFAANIVRERVLVILSPALFALLMQPFIQFWDVQKDSEHIEKAYQQATGYANTLFKEYESYAKERIDNYDKMLERIIRNKHVRPEDYRLCGFKDTNDEVQQKNKVEVLRTQLLSNNYQQLRKSAASWSQSDHKASVWNFFMQTNLTELGAAITRWHSELVGFSKKKLSDEEFRAYNQVEMFDAHDKLLQDVQKDLNTSTSYLQQSGESMKGIILSLVTYILLLIPYLIQKRNPKSLYHLFNQEKVEGGLNMKVGNNSSDEAIYKGNDTDFSFAIEEDEENYSPRRTASQPHNQDNIDMEFILSENEDDRPTRKKRRARRTSSHTQGYDTNDDSFTL